MAWADEHWPVSEPLSGGDGCHKPSLLMNRWYSPTLATIDECLK